MAQSFWFDGFTDEQIETIRAFAHAVRNNSTKDIEYYDKEKGWGSKETLYAWFSIHDKYRIRSEPKYISFTFDDAKKLIGQTIIIKEKNEYAVVISVNESFVETKNDKFGFGYLKQYCTFLDGSPCGKIEK